MWAIVRLLGILSTASFAGSWLAQQPDKPTDKVGFAGWWASMPLITKVVLWVAVITGILAMYNYMRYGNVKGKGGKL